MKIEKISFGATIKTGEYAGITPYIELSDVTIKEAEDIGLSWIKELAHRFSVYGDLKEREIVVKSSADKINEIGL
jgi:hypothetical protein